MGHMAEALDQRVNARVPQRVKKDLADLSRRRKLDESELARTLLDEALRRERHPGIVFRATPAGREAAIEGRRLYIWQVIETLRASDGSAHETAQYLGLRPDQVRTAAQYYAEFPDEIEQLIALNLEQADHAHLVWQQQQVLRA